jgi:hypothetical protein
MHALPQTCLNVGCFAPCTRRTGPLWELDPAARVYVAFADVLTMVLIAVPLSARSFASISRQLVLVNVPGTGTQPCL